MRFLACLIALGSLFAGGLLRGLRANDSVCDWRPRAPVRLFAARGDRVVTIANTRHCARTLRTRGAQVTVTASARSTTSRRCSPPPLRC
jgi:hypothetical protein